MKRHVLMDTGPLVAFVNRKDALHGWAKAMFGEIEAPMLTCEPVLTEVCHLLRNVPDGAETAMAFVSRGVIQAPFHLEDHTQSVRELLKKYASVPMSLADACLVRMSELYEGSAVFTIDRDFRIYRRHTRKAIPCFMPPST